MTRETRVAVDPNTAQLIDALSVQWQCSFAEALRRCVSDRAAWASDSSRLVSVVLRGQAAAAARIDTEYRYEQFGGVDAPAGWFPGCEE